MPLVVLQVLLQPAQEQRIVPFPHRLLQERGGGEHARPQQVE